MKLLLKWYWLLSGFIHKYFLGISLGLIVGIIAFTQGPKLLKFIPIKQTVHLGRVGAFTLSTIPLDIQQKVSRGLTKITPNGQVELDLAQTVSISEDGTVYTLTLNPDSTWSTGEPINSNELQLSLKDIQVAYPDQYSITFTLPEPYAPFLSILTQPLMKKVTEGTIVKKTRIVGVNEFSITNVKTQNQFIQSLTLNSKNTTLVYRFYPTEQEALISYKAGHIDQIENLSSPYLSDWSNTEILQDNSNNRYLALFFNTANSTLQDKTIRQLLTYATPKFEERGRVISPIDKNSWVYNPQVKPYHQSLTTAQSMLDKLKSSNNMTITLELTTTPAYTEEAQKIIEAWQSIGVETKLKIVSFPDPNDYQVLLIGQQIPDDPDQYALWHSTQSTNITHYQNAKIDKLLEDGRKERDPDKRKQIYQDFQRFLVEDNPVAFLHELPTFTLKRR